MQSDCANRLWRWVSDKTDSAHRRAFPARRRITKIITTATIIGKYRRCVHGSSTQSRTADRNPARLGFIATAIFQFSFLNIIHAANARRCFSATFDNSPITVSTKAMSARNGRFIHRCVRIIIGFVPLQLLLNKGIRKFLNLTRKFRDRHLIQTSRFCRTMIKSPIDLTPGRLAALRARSADQYAGAAAVRFRAGNEIRQRQCGGCLLVSSRAWPSSARSQFRIDASLMKAR